MHTTPFICNACCILRAASCVLRPACCVLRAASCVLRPACCVLRAASCVLRPACCVLRAASCVLRAASYGTASLCPAPASCVCCALRKSGHYLA